MSSASCRITGYPDIARGRVNQLLGCRQATIAVLMSLPTFNGKSGKFYKWVKRVIKNHCRDGFNKGISESKARVPFLVENKDGDTMENPELYPTEMPPEHQRELPEFIQGKDLKICEYIREGYDYAKIAQILSMTEKAVKHRVARMYKTNVDLGLAKKT